MPTNMSMGDLLSPALEAGNSGMDQAIKGAQQLNQGAQTTSNIQGQQNKSAIDMAQSIADLKTKQAKQDEMQQQLVDTKYDSLTKRIQQQQNIQNPEIRKRVAEANDKAGLAYKGFFSDLHTGYEDDPEKNAALAKYLTGGKPSQDEMQQILTAVQDPSAAHQGFELIKNKLQGEAMAAAATIRGNATVEAAKYRTAPGSPQQIRAQSTITNNYSRAIKPFEATLNAVDQLKEVLGKVDSGELSDAKNVKAEIESKMASVFGGGKPSTVFGTQAVGLDSSYGDFQNKMNHIFGEAKGVLTDAQKAQLHQELNVFGANAAKQHEDTFLTHRELVPEQYAQPIEQSYARYRAQKGLPSHIEATGPAISAGKPVTQTAAPASKYDFSQVDPAKIQAARAAGYNDDAIAAKLGIKAK